MPSSYQLRAVPPWFKLLWSQAHMQALHPGAADSGTNCAVYHIALMVYADAPSDLAFFTILSGPAQTKHSACAFFGRPSTFLDLQLSILLVFFSGPKFLFIWSRFTLRVTATCLWVSKTAFNICCIHLLLNTQVCIPSGISPATHHCSGICISWPVITL